MKQTKKCPLCKSQNTKLLFKSYNRHGRHDIDTIDKFQIMRCRSCDLVFIANVEINSRYYEKYYDTGYYDGGLNENASIVQKAVHALESWSTKQKEKNLLKYAPSRKQKIKILDVGCGSGKFLNSLDPKRFEKYGIEINKEGIELSRKKGLKVYEKDITQINFEKKKFDIITLWHVEEHLIDPIGVFKKINEILEDDGILLSATPNADSLGFKIGKAKWFHLDSPRHLMLFNLKSTEYLCKKSNFTILNRINEFYDFPLDLLWSVKDTPYKYLIYPFYPIVKYFDAEALTLIFKKSNM